VRIKKKNQSEFAAVNFNSFSLFQYLVNFGSDEDEVEEGDYVGLTAFDDHFIEVLNVNEQTFVDRMQAFTPVFEIRPSER
jgi:hypothetical protein